MVAVIAKLRVKEGKMDEAIEAFQGFLPTVQGEEGTRFYSLNRDRSDPNLLVVIEQYDDDAAFQAHSSSQEIAELFVKAEALLDAPLDLQILDQVASI